MKKIFVICSKAFYKDIKPIKEKLEENNWEVFVPWTYEKPEAEAEWYAKGEEEHAKMKGEMFRKSRDRIKDMDAVLTLNFDKIFFGSIETTFCLVEPVTIANKKPLFFNLINSCSIFANK